MTCSTVHTESKPAASAPWAKLISPSRVVNVTMLAKAIPNFTGRDATPRSAAPGSPAELARSAQDQAPRGPEGGERADGDHHQRPGHRGALEIALRGLLGWARQGEDVSHRQRPADGEHQVGQEALPQEHPPSLPA